MTGISARNLKYMRVFADTWPDSAIVQQVAAQLPWGHNIPDLGIGQRFRIRRQSVPVEVGDQEYFLDLLFYHLRLRCFVVIELKVEGFKPEFAGKMNFYLSAVDDLLRHPDDRPSIGIILCKGRNEIVVEYALRDSGKPMGVAQYRVSTSLPERLKGDLPTVEDLEQEFRSMQATDLRHEVPPMPCASVSRFFSS